MRRGFSRLPMMDGQTLLSRGATFGTREAENRTLPTKRQPHHRERSRSQWTPTV
jgi:hypothetical protein